jgi:hypothetical protein
MPTLGAKNAPKMGHPDYFDWLDVGLLPNGSQVRLPFGQKIRLDAELATRDPNGSEQAGAEERERSRLRNRRRNS